MMSCNGCRILRKGCSENCVLRQSLQAIDSPQAQANATLFVAKFFGRAGLMSFLSSVPESQRSALFQSLLYEACGRTVNPVTGSVGLLWTGNWSVCQTAVETVLRGGEVHALPEFSWSTRASESDECSEDDSSSDLYGIRNLNVMVKKKGCDEDDDTCINLDLRLTAGFSGRMTPGGQVKRRMEKTRRESTYESDTTTLDSNYVNGQDLQGNCNYGHGKQILRLFH